MGCIILPVTFIHSALHFARMVVVGLISNRFSTPFVPGSHLIFTFTTNNHKPGPTRRTINKHFVGTQILLMGK